MNKQDISIISNAVIAFSTVIGVGGATYYYMAQIRGITTGSIILAEIIYLMSIVLFIYIIRDKINMKKRMK